MLYSPHSTNLMVVLVYMLDVSGSLMSLNLFMINKIGVLWTVSPAINNTYFIDYCSVFNKDVGDTELNHK